MGSEKALWPVLTIVMIIPWILLFAVIPRTTATDCTASGLGVVNCTHGDTSTSGACTASGCCWDTGTIPNCHLPNREIEGFDVSVAPVEFGQTSFIVIAGTAGTDVTIFCDYGDDVYGSGTIEEDWTSDIIGARNFNITYEQIGRYNVTCWVSNDRSYLVTSVEACVDQAQRGTFTVPDTNIADDSITHVTPAITAGSFLTLSIYYGDDTEVVQYSYDNYTMMPSMLNYAYVQMGRYEINATLCNCLSCTDTTMETKVGVPITSSDFTDSGATKLGSSTNFTAMLSNSSQTSCVFKFGDGYYTCVYNLFTNAEPIVVDHTYNATGTYNTSLYCENLFGNVTYEGEVHVDEEVNGTALDATRINIIDGETAVIGGSIVAGTGVVFAGLCDGVSCGSVTVLSPMEASVAVGSVDLPPYGDTNFTFTASNSLNMESKEAVIGTDISVTGAAFTTDPIFVRTNDNHSISVSCATGSRVNFQLRPGDNSKILTLYFSDETHNAVFVNSWASPGSYIANNTAVNNVSMDSSTATVYVENVVPPMADISISSNNVTDVSDTVNLAWNYTNPSSVDVLSAQLEVDFNDDTETVDIQAPLVAADDGMDGSVDHVFSRYGDFSVSGKFHNNVSNETFSGHMVRVGIPVSGALLTVSTRLALTGAPITFDLYVDAGSNVTHLLDTGNGQTQLLSRSTTTWDASDNKTWVYNYTTNGTFNPTLSSSNVFDSLGPISLDGAGYITILAAMPDLSLTTPQFYKTDDVNTVYVLQKLNPSDGAPSGTVTCDWTYDGVLVEQDVATPNLVSDVPNTHTHAEAVVGSHTTSVNCTNTISWKAATVTFTAEKCVSGAAIAVAADAVAVGAVASFTFTLSAGSHVTHVLDFGDGTPDGTSVHPNTADSTSGVTLQHTYTTRGNRTVSLLSKNDVCNETVTAAIVVQDAIPDGITLDVAQYAKPGDTEVFTIRPPSGVTLDDAHCELNPGDGGSNIAVFAGDLAQPLNVPYTFQANNNPPDSTPHTLNCSNLISSKIVSGAVKLENAVAGFTFNLKFNGAAFIAVKTNDPVLLSMATTAGTDLVFEASYDDTSPNDTLAHTTDPEPILNDFSHTFSDPGTHTVTVRADNHLSQATLVRQCVVQNPVVEADLVFTVEDSQVHKQHMTVIKNGIGGTIDITIAVTAGSPVPTDAHANITYKQGDAAVSLTIDTFPKTFTTDRYTTTGDETIVVVVYNLVSDVTTEHNITIEEQLQQPTSSVSALVIFPNPLDKFDINITTGSHVKTSIDFGDGSWENTTILNVRGPHKLNFSGHSYTLPGAYTIKIYWKNDFDAFSATFQTTIVADLPNMTLTTDSVRELPPGDTSVAVGHFKLIIASEDRLQVSCNVHLDSGDGATAPQIYSRSIVDDIAIEHSYTSTGDYFAKINVTTLFDFKYFETFMRVHERLSEVRMVIKKVEETIEEGKYPVGSSLDVEFIYQGTGANKSLMVTNKDSGEEYYSKVTNDTHVLVVFSTVGIFDLSVIVDNGIGNDDVSGDFPRKAYGQVEIEAEGVILSFEYPATTSAGEPNNYILKFTNGFALDGMCTKLRLGNEVFFYAMQEAVCTSLQGTYIAGHTVKIHDGTEQIVIEDHVFNEAGLTDVYANVTHASGTQFSMVSGFINVTVYCYKPIITVTPGELLTGFRARTIHIEMSNFEIEFRCTATSEIHTLFTIVEYSNFTTKELGDDITGSINTSVKADGLYIDPLQLNIGHIQVRLTVAMGPKNGGYAMVKETNYVEFKVLASPFTVRFLVGIYQMLGNTVNAALYAEVTNPDYPGDISGYDYKWICYVDEAEDAWALLNVNSAMTAPLIAIPTNGSGLDNGAGGCFNTGPGVLDVADTSSVQLSLSTSFMPVSKIYVFVAYVTKGGVTVNTTTRVEVADGVFRVVNVSCSGINCLPKVNPQQSMYLTGICSTCPENDYSSYTWTVTETAVSGKRRKRAAGGLSDPVIQNHYRESIMEIPPGTLSEGKHYTIDMAVDSPDRGKGKMLYDFYVNYKPRGGSCSISPTTGNTSTLFVFACKDWQDEGGVRSEYFVVKEGASLNYEFYYLDRSDPPVERFLAGSTNRLPSGDPADDYKVQLKAYIIDELGMKADYSFQVQVHVIEDQSAMVEAVGSLVNTDISQVLLDLDKSLNLLAIAASTVQASLDARITAGNYVEPPSTNSLFSPPGSYEEERALQAQQEEQKVVDAAMGLYDQILSPDNEVPPSLSQVITVAKTVSSTPLSTDALPSTMSSGFSVVGNLGAVLDVIEVDPTDPESVLQTQALLDTTLDVASQVMSASIFVLSRTDQAPDAFSVAITDESIDEDEEERQSQANDNKQESMDKVDSAAKSVLSAVASITSTLSKMTVATTTMTTPMLTLTVSAPNPEKPLSEQPVNIVDSSGKKAAITFGDFSASDGDKPVIQAAAINKALFKGRNSEEVGGPVITCSLSSITKDGEIIPSEGIDFSLQQEQVKFDDVPKNSSSTAVWNDDTGMMYMSATLTNFSAFHVLITPAKTEGVTVKIYVMTNETCGDWLYDCRPNKTNYVFKRELPQLNLTNPWQATFRNMSGFIYVGALVEDTVPGSPRPEFTMKTGVSKCPEFSSRTGTWTMEGGCVVSENSTMGSPMCDCKTPSSSRRRRAATEEPETVAYSTSFTAPTVNTIDFKNIFKNFADLLGNNAAVFATTFVILGIYIMLAIWARWSDRKDIEKWSVLPLVGNLPHHRNYYKVSVFTGMRRNAGTKSNICFILTGDNADTGVMELKDQRNRLFSNSSIRQFVLATEQELGALTFMRIWHDNSGKGDLASWYMEKIIVEDLQTKNRYFFLCGRWFAIEEDDGSLDRILPVAGRDEILTFNHLFFDKARRKLFDDHLWISLVGRPSRSNFTRLQRLTCILCLLFTTMVTNAMFYGQEKVENDKAIKIGPITLSAANIIVSIYGSLAVIPINTIVMMLFRKHRPKDWPSDDEVVGANGERIKVQTTEGATKKKTKWWKAKYPLPYWCAYVAWILAIACTVASMLFVILYSLQWGKEKADGWLSTLLLSMAQSVVLVQPIKVLFLAGMLALLFKTLDDDDEDPGERHNNGKIKPDEEFTDENLIRLNDLVKLKPPEPLSKRKLEKAREKRKYENQVWVLVKEGGLYFAFLMLVCFIVWGSRNPMLYYTNNMILEEMAGSSVKEFKETVTNWREFWEWSRATLVPQLFYMYHYNGKPGTPRDRQFLSDGVNFRVGPLVMRQARVKPGSCKTLKRVQKHIIECNDVYSLIDEEDRNFTYNWKLDPRDNYTMDELKRSEEAYKYRSFVELKTTPYWGQMATYGGGGYVANLGITKKQALTVLNELLQNDWVDYYTRAVFVEFTIYNPNINMFAYVNYLLESPATGAIIPYPKIMAFQLYTRLSGMTLVVVACQILYMILISFFMIREGFQLKRLGKKYWREPWNYIELAIIIMSWAVMALFVLREFVGRHVMDTLMADTDKFMNFSLFAYYDEIYWYLIGVIVFLCNTKFLRLLRFNKHISQFAGTLKHARKDLMYFSITFALLFMAFTASGFLIFNRYTLDFNSVISVMESLYSMLIGKFDFREMEKADRFLGPLYFVMFMILMFFVVVNMFLGIIGNAYAEVCQNPNLAGDDYRVMEFIMSKATKYMGIKKKKIKEEVKYMDSMDTLNMRLDALDQLVTQDCRTILGLERQALQEDAEHQRTAPTKEKMLEDDNKKVQNLAFLTKLQQSSSTSGTSYRPS